MYLSFYFLNLFVKGKFLHFPSLRKKHSINNDVDMSDIRRGDAGFFYM
jgi:hypothetical protein